MFLFHDNRCPCKAVILFQCVALIFWWFVISEKLFHTSLMLDFIIDVVVSVYTIKVEYVMQVNFYNFIMYFSLLI